MESNNPVLLKSSMFGGFKKKEVLSYIFELNESTQEAQQKFAEQIEELSLSRDALVHNVAELEMKLSAAQAELDESNERLEAESQKNFDSERLIDKLKSEAAIQQQNLVQKNDEAKRYAVMNTELAEKNRKLEEKRGQVELAAAQIADLLGKAQSDADRLMELSNREAENIKASARDEADKIIRDAKTIADNTVEETNASLEAAYGRFDNFCLDLGDIQKTIADISFDLNSKMQEIIASARQVRDRNPQPPDESDERAFELDELQPEEASEAPANTNADTAEAEAFANDILGKYGVRKDDSGFFRLAAER